MKARVAVVLFLGFVIGSAAWAQQDFSDVTVEATRVADGIYMLTGAGGNIGVSVGDDGVFLIDDQYAPLTAKIVAQVKKIDEHPIQFVFNTHWHGDHTGGNENLGKSGTLIVAHDNVRQRLSTEQFMELWDQKRPPSPDGGLPVVTFSDSVTFHLNGNTIRAFHVAPAHTDGDSMVFFKEDNVLHTGDVVFNGLFPFIDTGAGGSLAGMIAAVDVALEMVDAETKIIPGHGPLTDREGLLAYREMLTGVEAAVAPMVRDGKSLDEIIEAEPLEPFMEQWGEGFLTPEQFLTTVYWGMTRN